MTKDTIPTPDGEQPSGRTGEQPSEQTQYLSTEGTEQLPVVDDPSAGADWTHAQQTEAELRHDADTAAAAAAGTPSAAAAGTPSAAAAGTPSAADTPAAAHAVPVVPVAAAGSGGDGPRRPGFWARLGEAWRTVWSRTWGKVAVIAISGLAILALIAAIGLAAFAGGRDRDHRMAGRDGSASCAQGQGGKGGSSAGRGHGGAKEGSGCGSDGQEQGQGQGRGKGEGANGNQPGARGRGEAQPGVPGQGVPSAPGNGTGRGGKGGGAAGGAGGQSLANALHGELVLGGVSPRTVLFQVGEVTEFTAGQSLAVKSSDGFTATYTLTADTSGPATGVAVGATVRVVADKDGAKATRVQLLDSAVATG